MPHMVMAHESDPKDILLKEVGDISGFEICNNQVLCAIYIRPQKTRSGIYLTDKTVDEDRYQGKVGLVVRLGPDAFVETEKWAFKTRADVMDWIVFRPSDGWGVTVNGVLCRMLDDVDMRGRISHPDQVW